jgi:hypothetical protein
MEVGEGGTTIEGEEEEDEKEDEEAEEDEGEEEDEGARDKEDEEEDDEEEDKEAEDDDDEQGNVPETTSLSSDESTNCTLRGSPVVPGHSHTRYECPSTPARALRGWMTTWNTEADRVSSHQDKIVARSSSARNNRRSMVKILKNGSMLWLLLRGEQ